MFQKSFYSRFHRLRILTLVTVVGLLLSAAIWTPGQTPLAQLWGRVWSARPASVQTDPITAAWEQVKATGSYHFSSDVTQTTTPSASVRNVGRRSQTDQLYLEGMADIDATAMEFRLWSGGGSLLQDGSSLAARVADGKTYTKQNGGDWQEASDFTQSLAPAGDFMSYLVAARGITDLGQETRAGLTFTRYAFTLDGPTFAHSVQQQMEEAMRLKGDVPEGISFAVPSYYSNMTGHGELWVSQDGLPVRQMLALQFPENKGEAVSAHITVNFSRFGYARSAIQASAGNIPAPIASLLAFLNATAKNLPSYLAFVTALFLAILLLGIVFYSRRVRRIRQALSLALVLSFVVGPVFNAMRMTRFFDAQTAQAKAQEDKQAESKLARDARSSASAPAFNPHQNPLAAAPAEAVLSRPLAGLAAPMAAPALQATTALTTPNGVDSDGDGLTDFAEQRVGTDPASNDTDGDLLLDKQEVDGFTYGGKNWYANPTEADSNNDDMADTIEWDPSGNGGLPDDTDGDGVPDLFDEDNDGDSVPDGIDLAPFVKGTVTYGRNAPLTLQVQNLNVRSTFVDFQLRPINQDFLWFSRNMLDWPQDDKGQFRDIDNQPADMTLVPMLEITIPDAANMVPPTAALEPYAINVSQMNNGTQIAYVPLSLVTDEKSGARVAFNGRMRYFPKAAWNAAHTVRLVWVVQMENDRLCAPGSAGYDANTGYCLNQPQIIHRYYEDWALTGLNVTEQHGAEFAVIYEDPAASGAPDNDDGAMALLAYTLEKRFLNAQKVGNSPAVRALTFNNLRQRFDRVVNDANGGMPYGLPDIFRVTTIKHDTFDEAIKESGKALSGVLDSVFATHWANNRSIKPLLTTTYEQKSRALSLDSARLAKGYATFNGAALTLNLSPAGQENVPLTTMVGMKWTPFCGGNGTTPAWEACAADAYWLDIGARLAGSINLDPNNPTTTVPTLDTDIVSGQTMVTQLFVLALMQGLNTVIQQEFSPTDNRILSTAAGQENEEELVGNVRIGLAFGRAAIKMLANIYFTRQFIAQAGSAAPILKSLAKYQIDNAALSGIKGTLSGFRANPIKAGLLGGALLIATAALVVLIYFAAKGNPDAQIVLEGLITGIAVSIGAVSAIYTTIGVVGALSGAFSPAQVLIGRSELIGASRGAAVVGAVLVIGVTWGFFIYGVVSNKVSAFSPEFNAALAQTIAATLYIIILTVLSFTVVGLILVGIITVVDGILTLVCQLKNKENCFTISGAATKAIATVIYAYDLMIDPGRADLIKSGSPTFGLPNPDGGYVTNATVVITLPMTTTIVHKDPEPKNAIKVAPYLWFFSKDKLRSSTFNYSLTSPISETLSAKRDERPAAWAEPTVDHKYAATPLFRTQKVDKTSRGVQFSQPGLNQSPDLYINMAYALPAYECWHAVWAYPPIPICYIRSFEGGLSNKIDGSLYFDILPDSLGGFVSLAERQGNNFAQAWDSKFTALTDADGDGLLSNASGGLDVNDSTWDSDKDGLSDAFEIEQRAAGWPYSPGQCDTDNDGLTDKQEAEFGSNPGIADSDNDGLLDREEVWHQEYVSCQPSANWSGGWNITINETTPFTIRVTSDPTTDDSDQDGVSDLAEKQLAQNSDPAQRVDKEKRPWHPAIANVPPIAVFVDVNDLDRFVGVGQKLVYTTTATTSVAVEPSMLDVNAPAEVGGPKPPALLPFNPSSFNTEQTVSSQTAFTISSGSNRQQLDFTSNVRARLKSSSPAPFAWEFAKAALSGIPAQPVRSQAIVPFGRDRQDSYQIPILTSDSSEQGGNGEIRYHLVPTNTLGVIPTSEGHKVGDTPPDIACNNAQTCLIVHSTTTENGFFSYVNLIEIDANGFFVDSTYHKNSFVYQPVIASNGTSFGIAYHTKTGIVFETWDHQFTTPSSTRTIDFPAFGKISTDVPKDLIWMGDRYRLVFKNEIYGGTDRSEIFLYDFSPTGVLLNSSTPVRFEQDSLVNANWSPKAGPALAYDPVHDEALLVYQSIEPKTRRVRLPKNIDSNTNWGALNTYLYEPYNGATFNSENFNVTYDQRFDKWLINLNGYLTYLSASAVRRNEGTLLSPFLTLEPLNKISLACPAASSLPVGDFRFEDFPGTATFSNAAPGTLPDGTSPKATCTAGTCPASGLPGATDTLNNAVGKPASDYSLRFDGLDDQITLPNAPNTPYTLGSEFSIAFWYKADGTATPLTTFYVQGSGNAPGFALNINSATLEFWAGTVASKISAPHSMNDGKWHFVTATRHGNGGLALYVDGVSKAAGVGSTAPVMPATLIVGGGHRAIGLDNLKLYNAALSGTTVQELYNRTDQSYCVGVANNQWSKLNISQPDPRGGKITASGGLSLTVDTDKPTSSLGGLTNGQYLKGLNTYIIGGNASDPTSGVSKVEVSLNNALQYVPASGAESWAYNLDLIEGEYNVRVRATDAVGNVEIPATPITIFADLTPPNVALNAIPATPLLPTRNADNVWTTRLTVTAQDRLSSGVRSGLPADGVEVRLDSDTEQGSWQTASRPNTNTTTWTIDYLFDAGLPDPTGTYTVNVRAADNVGNRTNGATAILRLDAAGPTAALSNQDATRDVISNTLTLSGEVADTGTAGVDKVEMAFVTIEKIAALPNNISAAEADAQLNRTWLPATLAQRGATVTRTTWSMVVPAGLEGIYQMDLRASDSLGNLRRSDNIWRGMVDLVAPRVTFTGTDTGRRFFRGLTTLYEMRYVCRADDWQLNEATFECPNNAQQIPSRGFNNDPALQALFPGLSLLNVMSNTYTVLQTSPQPVGSARACDSTGKCSTTTLAAAVQANALQTNRSVVAVQAPSTTTTPRAVILDPTEGSFVALAKGNAAVQVTLAGEASDGLKTIELFVDDALQSTIEFAEADAIKSVIRTVTIPAPTSGQHVLTVKATDWAGNTQAEPASTTVTFLTGLPSVEIDSEFVVLTDTYGLRSNMVILKGRVTTENLAAVKVKVNNGRWADARFADGRWEIAMPVQDLQSGQTLNVTVDAIDKFGQVKQHSMGEQVMLTEGGNPPDTNVIEGPSGETNALTATVSFSSTAGDRDVFGYECQVDEGGYGPCASPFALSVMSNGEHTVKVRAMDAEGYVDSTPATATWTVRSTQLEVTLTSAPSSTSYSRDAQFGFEAEGASGFECSLDGGEFAPCSSPQAYSGLEDGAHAFLVRAKNEAGLVSVATRFTWTVSNSAPVAQDQDVTVANNNSVAITLGATDSDALRYKLVSKPSNGVLHGFAPNLTYVPNTGFAGEDSFTFKATDAESDSEPATVRVTVTAPQTEGPSTLTIVLNAQPDAKQNFRFTSNLGNFRLDDPATDDGDEYKNSITFEVTPQRTYVFEEQVPGGWTLSNIVCDTPHEVNVPDATAEIVVNNNEQVTCTFVNVRNRSVGVLGEPGEAVDDDEAGYDDVTTTPAPGTKLYLPLVVN